MNESIERVLEARRVIQSAMDDFETACNDRELLKLARKGEKYDTTLEELKIAKERLSVESLKRLEPCEVFFEDLDGVLCCPSCMSQVDDVYRYCRDYKRLEPKFCPDCGQALLWENLD